MDIKLEDFEEYRYRLTRYAEGLLYSRGAAGNRWEECSNIAKDIVQNTYITFHNLDKSKIESKEHLSNLLKTCLYRRYRDFTNINGRNAQHSMFKTMSLRDLKDKLCPIVFPFYHQIDSVEFFLSSKLTAQERFIVYKLLEGFTQVEIAKKVNMSKQAIHQRIGRIQNKYRLYEKE